MITNGPGAAGSAGAAPAAAQTTAGLQTWVFNGTSWNLAYTLSAGLNRDQGADPNKLVSITDQRGATSPAPGKSFSTVQSAGYGQVLRGVSFTPGTGAYRH